MPTDCSKVVYCNGWGGSDVIYIISEEECKDLYLFPIVPIIPVPLRFGVFSKAEDTWQLFRFK